MSTCSDVDWRASGSVSAPSAACGERGSRCRCVWLVDIKPPSCSKCSVLGGDHGDNLYWRVYDPLWRATAVALAKLSRPAAAPDAVCPHARAPGVGTRASTTRRRRGSRRIRSTTSTWSRRCRPCSCRALTRSAPARRPPPLFVSATARARRRVHGILAGGAEMTRDDPRWPVTRPRRSAPSTSTSRTSARCGRAGRRPAFSPSCSSTRTRRGRKLVEATGRADPRSPEITRD